MVDVFLHLLGDAHEFFLLVVHFGSLEIYGGFVHFITSGVIQGFVQIYIFWAAVCNRTFLVLALHCFVVDVPWTQVAAADEDVVGLAVSICVSRVRDRPCRDLTISVQSLLIYFWSEGNCIFLFLVVKHLISNKTIPVAQLDATAMHVAALNRGYRHSACLLSHRCPSGNHWAEVVLGWRHCPVIGLESPISTQHNVGLTPPIRLERALRQVGVQF